VQQCGDLRRDDDTDPVDGQAGRRDHDSPPVRRMSLVDGLLTWTEQLLQSAGPLGLAAVMAAEAVLPIPSEVVLPVVGARVSSGGVAMVTAVAATTAGSVLGAAVVYALARWGGKRWVTRLTRLLGVSSRRWTRTETWFARRGALVVLLGRLVPGVRCVVPLPAGSLGMPLPRFLGLTAVGSALWNGAWIGGGAWLTADWDTLVSAMSTAVTTAAISARPVLMAAAVAGVVVVLLDHGRFHSLVGQPAARW
jgi:membrane protein DedA with SNARE-associated domain